jgi:hypothetical protein
MLDRTLLRCPWMRMFVRAVAGLAVAVAVVASPSSIRAQGLIRAEEPPPPKTAIGLDLGVGSAIGFAGITLARALGEYAQIELGTGIGFSGYQFSVMPKLVLSCTNTSLPCTVMLSGSSS